MFLSGNVKAVEMDLRRERGWSTTMPPSNLDYYRTALPPPGISTSL